MESIVTLFVNKSKAGATYLSGTKDGHKIVAFQNSKRPGKADPDYRLYVVKAKGDKNEYVPCGALWLKTSRSKKAMCSGYFGTSKEKEINVVGFLNVSKDGHKQFYSIYKEEPKPVEEKPVDIKVANSQAIIEDDDIQF